LLDVLLLSLLLLCQGSSVSFAVLLGLVSSILSACLVLLLCNARNIFQSEYTKAMLVEHPSGCSVNGRHKNRAAHFA
jgi:hypothetical protein